MGLGAVQPIDVQQAPGEHALVPAPIRERFQLGPATWLKWIVESDGSIRVVPVDAEPIDAFRVRSLRLRCPAAGGTPG